MTLDHSAGVIPGFFSSAFVNIVVAQLQQFPSQPVDYGICHGVSPGHKGYPWFKKSILTPIAEKFNLDLKLGMGMYLDINNPFGIHSDMKHIPSMPGISFLIPVSVNHGNLPIELATTDVFLERDDGIAPPAEPTLQLQARWSVGDLIWWETDILHTSGAFNGFDNKQAIVLHTYV